MRVLLISILCFISSTILFSQNDSNDIKQNDSLTIIRSYNLPTDGGPEFRNVSHIKSNDFNKGAIIYPQELIIGKSPGLLIYRTGIVPESTPSSSVRGVSSYNLYGEPLYVVNDVPVEPGFLNFLNVDDIKEIIVIRDGSGASLYGTKAANGVVVIKTKDPDSGKLKINYNGYVSISKLAKKADVFSADEIRKIAGDNVYGLFPSESISRLGSENTDWQDEIYRNGVSHNHHVGLSGGITFLPYRFSIGYTDINSILKNTGLKRMTSAINLAPSFFKNTLKLNLSAFSALTNNNLGDQNAISSAISMDPTQPVFDGNESSDNYFQWENYGASLGTPNPVEQLTAVDNKNNIKRFMTNLELDYSFPFIKGLRLNFSYKAILSDTEGHNNRPTGSPDILTWSNWGLLSDYHDKKFSKLTDLFLNYTENVSKIDSKIDFKIGVYTQEYEYEGDSYIRSISDDLHPTELIDSSSFSNVSELSAFYGSFNYSLKDRYHIRARLRKEGSSFFSEKNKWELFPFYSFSWDMGKERFIQNLGFINNLNLYISYGKSGVINSNNSILQLIGSISSGSYDPNLTWETKTDKHIGIDFAVLNNRIRYSASLYQKNIDDLILAVAVPPLVNLSGYVLTNLGRIENRGIEMSLDVVLVSTPDVSVKLGINFTQNKNTTKELNLVDGVGITGILYNGIQITTDGYPVCSFFVNQQIYDTEGNPIEGLYVDLSGDGGVVTDDKADKYMYHNPRPDYFLGFSFEFSFKQLEFYGSTHANVGNYIYNGLAASASYDQMYQLDYWRNFSSALNETNFISRQLSSDYFIENASFLKIDHLTLAYTFTTTNKIKPKIKAYVSVQNPFVFTRYEGVNPEIAGGVDIGLNPYAKSFLLGLNIGLN